MERGIPDSTAYMQLCGVKKDRLLANSLKKSSYKKVFLVELLEYDLDYARIESPEQAKMLEDLLEKSYTDLGIKVIRVPKMSVTERADFVLNNL